MSSGDLKESFEPESKYGPFYTGGNIAWSEDGEHLLCQKGGTITVLSVNKGLVILEIGTQAEKEEDDNIHTFAIGSDVDRLVTHHKSGLFKLWDWKDGKLLKLWKSIHKGPVAKIVLSKDGTIMASGGSDGSVRLWDLQHHACTHSLKGIQGVTSVLAFHPDTERSLLFGAADDTKIHAWNIRLGQETLVLSGHFSRVTALCFHDDGIHAVSSGRDRVLILWDITKGTSVRVLPVYEGIEGAFLLPSDCSVPFDAETPRKDSIYVTVAGEKGLVRIWEMKAGREVYVQENSLVAPAKEEGGLAITHLLYNSSRNSVALVSADHNIIIHKLDTFECTKQLVGYSDEILDLAYIGPSETYLAVATNSPEIKLYELSTMNCQLLRGHTDLILALSTTKANKYLFLSSAKDNSVRVWLMDTTTMKVSCIGCGTRHTASVGSIALAQTTANFFVSASQDSCLKLWELPANLTETKEEVSLNATHTVLAHQKDINSVTVSPNDKLIATGSQDKTAKLWSATDLQLLGTLRGHRRGVWCVRFSPIDQVLITTSADCTVKFWSLSDLNCLKTLEGHESSVLRAEFLSRGMQVITAGGDGLLKLWSVKTSECTCTLELHENRVWALAVSKNESHVVSGGSDSLLVIWRDVTQENKAKAAAEGEALALEEQKLANLLKVEKLTEALKLALKLEKPFQVLKIVEGIIKKGENELKDTIQDLKPIRKEALLRCAVTWNTNSRNAQAAQLVINVLLNEIGTEDLKPDGLSSTLEKLIPYTERHHKRLTKLLQDLHLLRYTVNRMKPHNMSIED